MRSARLRLVAIALCLTVLPAGRAAAGAPPSTDLSTTVLAPYVPPGWKPSNVKFGGIVSELGEFTPTGVPTEQFTDLVGYAIAPAPPNPNPPQGAALQALIAGAARNAAPQKCTASVVLEHVPPGEQKGWIYTQQFCVLKGGEAAGEIDLTFNALRLEPHGLFTVWRAWRGSPADFRKLLKDKAGVDADGLTAAATFDDAVVNRVVGPLLSAWSDVFAKVELCDLAVGEICSRYRPKTPSIRALHPDAPGDGKSAFKPSDTQTAEMMARLSNSTGPTAAGDLVGILEIAGSHELNARQAAEAQAKMSGANGEAGKRLLASLDADKSAKGIQLSQSITPSNHDFSVPQGYIAALLQPWLGSRADGGTLLVLNSIPPVDALTRARLQAYLVKAEHLTWGLAHVAPERMTLSLYPAP